jgi:acyl carrier protein
VTQASEIRSRIQNEITDFIAQEILHNVGRNVSVDEPLISSGLIDSFHLVDLALFVEETFNVRIDDTELHVSVFDSVQELVDLILERMQGEAE